MERTVTDVHGTLLVVDDAETNIGILSRMLKDYEVMVASDGSGCLEVLEREHPDLILLDIMMPGMDGYEVCRRIKAREAWRDIPVLFLTARTDEASIVKGFDVGGSDYVTKPFRARELLARVKTQLQYKRALEQLRRMAVTDELTGIPNRRAFFDRGAVLFETARREGMPLAAMMIDLDDFKHINDRYGHGTGDRALQSFAACIRERLGENDLFGRLGGEEFAVIPPDRTAHEAVAFAEALRAAVSDLALTTGEGELRMTVSIGIAFADAATRDLDALLFAADEQLYRAKREQKNCTRHSEIPAVGSRLRGRSRD
jgi:diguanylate cyclase (GGDEF)-like protein